MRISYKRKSFKKKNKTLRRKKNIKYGGGDVKISVIPDFIFNINDITTLEKPMSDHALIRVEFEKFVVYSLNILNGEDRPALKMTINDFSILNEIWKQINIIKKEEKYDTNKVEELFKIKNDMTNEYMNKFVENNNKRMTNIIEKLKVLEEDKPIIFCFQEVGPEIKKLIETEFNDKTVLSSEKDNICIFNPKDKTFKHEIKDEFRVTVLPNEFTVGESDVEHIKIPNEREGYKTAILTPFTVEGTKYNLCNTHINFRTPQEKLVDFFTKLKEKENLIIIGDFNNNLELNFSQYFNDKLKYLAPKDPTFIVDMGLKDLEKSKIIDQVVYNF